MAQNKHLIHKMRTKGGTKTKALEKGREGWTVELDDMGEAEYAAKSYVDAISKSVSHEQGEQKVDRQGNVIEEDK